MTRVHWLPQRDSEPVSKNADKIHISEISFLKHYIL